MIIFSEKKIHYWSKWRTKNKFLFCLTSGFVYSFFIFILNLIIRPILGHTENLVEESFYISLCSLIPASFLSIALWYENERRFKLWKAKVDKKPINKTDEIDNFTTKNLKGI